MADRLPGISLSEAEIANALKSLFSDSGSTTKTFEVKTKGFKEVAKETKEATEGLRGFGEALNALSKSKGGQGAIQQLKEITELASGKFQKVNISSFLNDLNRAMSDPSKNAKQLAQVINEVHSNLTALSDISRSRDFSFFTPAEIKKVIETQKTIGSLQTKYKSEQKQRYDETAEYGRKVDVATAARMKGINKDPHAAIAEKLGVNAKDINLAKNDDALLQDYQQIANVLQKMIEGRKEFNDLNSKNVGDYVEQEKGILSVFKQLQDAEKKITERFPQISPDKLLSNQFKNGKGTFDFEKNATTAVNAYVEQMTAKTTKELSVAREKLNKQVRDATAKSIGRTEAAGARATKGRTTTAGEVAGQAAGVQAGEAIGEGVEAGMEKAAAATEAAKASIQEYVGSVEDSIDKIYSLFNDIDDLNDKIDSGLSSKEEDKAYDELEKKYLEIGKHRANLERHGLTTKDFDSYFGKEEREEVDAYVKPQLQDSAAFKKVIDSIKAEPIEIPVQTKVVDTPAEVEQQVAAKPVEVPISVDVKDESKEEISDVTSKVEGLSDAISNRTSVTIFDGVSEKVYNVEKDIDELLAKLDEMAQKMQTPVFHAGDLTRENLASADYRPADSLKFVTERHRGDSMGTGTFFGSNMGDIIEAFKTKTANGGKAGIFAADMSKYQNSLLKFNSDDAQDAFGEFLRKVTAFVMSIATEDEKFESQLGNIEKGNTESLFNELKSWFDTFHVNMEALQQFVDNEVQYVKGFSSTAEMGKADSIGTRFQKQFIGSNGVDITRGALNDSYAIGSLIFDLDKQHPFDISFGNNEDIATLFYQKVLERILSGKAANPENYIEDLVGQYVDNSGIPSVEKMSSSLTPKLEAIHAAHQNDIPETIQTLNAALLSKNAPAKVDVDTSGAVERLKALEAELQTIKSELQGFQDTDMSPAGIERMKVELEHAEQEIKDLDHALQDSVGLDSYTDLSIKLEDAQSEAQSLREQLDQLQDVKPGSEDEIAEYKGQLEAAKAEAKSLQETLGEFQKSGLEPEGVSKLKGQLEQAEQRAESLSYELASVYDRSFDDSEYEALEESLAQSKEEAQGLSEELARVKQEKEEMQASSAQQDATASKAEHMATAEASTQADEQAAQAARDRASADAELAKAESEVNAAESANDGTPRVDMAAKNAAQAAVDTNVEAETAKITALNAEITNVLSAISSKNAALSAEQGIVDGAVSAEVMRFKELKTAIDDVTSSAENKNGAMNDIKSNAVTTPASTVKRNAGGSRKAATPAGEQAKTDADYINEAIKKYDELISKVDSYAQLKQKAADDEIRRGSEQVKLDELTQKQEEAAAAAAKYGAQSSELAERQERFNNALEISTQYYSENSKAAKEAAAQAAAQAKEAAAQAKEQERNLSIVEKQMSKISSYDKDRFQDQYKPLKEQAELLKQGAGDFEKYQEAYAEFQKHAKIGEGDILPGNFGSLDDAKSRAQEIVSSYKTVLKDLSGSTTIDSSGLAHWTATVRDAEGNVQQLKFTWNDAAKQMAQSAQQLPKQTVGLSAAIDGVKNKVKELATYWTARLFDPYRIISGFKSLISTVQEYDDALTEMRKVSDESLSTLKQFQKESFSMADNLGTTGKQIQNSTADWLRLGESFDEAKKSAEVSNLLLNVSEFTSIDDATQSLVSASQAYKDLDKIEIVDKLNNIGNNFSISTDQLAEGLQNAAAVLKTQGNDIDQSLALLTAGNAITQNISKTSAGIRTISLRISGTEEAKNEIADMGEDIDDFVVRTKSKTDSIIRDYTAVASNAYQGVSVLDPNGNLRDTYSILLDIAQIYKEIQAEDKQRGTNRAQALVETLAPPHCQSVQKCA